MNNFIFRINVEKDLEDLLRDYSLNILLRNILNESWSIYLDKSNIKGALYRNIRYFNKNNGLNEQGVYSTAWDLVDLAYFASKYTTDFRGRPVKDVSEICCLESRVRDEIVDNNYVLLKDSFDSESDHILYLFGFGGEEFKFQRIPRVKENMIRELHILFSPSNDTRTELMNVIYKETRGSWVQLVGTLIIMWILSYNLKDCNYKNKLIESIKWTKDYSKEYFENSFNLYVASVEDIRSSLSGRQILYSKPVIKTQKGEYIPANCYLLLFRIEHAVYWLLRDHYKNCEQSYFVSEFGKWYEKYFEQLLYRYLDEKNYNHIRETSTPRADWEIHLGNIVMLIEQKSSLMEISVKQQNTDPNKYKEYIRRNIFEALIQLQTTEEDIGIKCIKVILLYDDFIAPRVLDAVLNMKDCPINDDGRFWILTISEMERLLYLFKYNRSRFEKIMKLKINTECSKTAEDRDLGYIMQREGFIGNPYINEIGSMYTDEIDFFIKEHIKIEGITF